MFIEFEETPNPVTLKFLPGREVFPSGTRDYKQRGDASESPLAQRLFDIDGVEGVFLGRDFISVTCRDPEDWDALKPKVLSALMEHFSADLPVIDEAALAKTSAEKENEDNEDGEIARQIRELLDTRVKPAVAMDGGNIEFISFDDGVVYLRMEGACAGCPSSTMTLKHGIENMLKHYVPEVVRVEPEDAY